MDERRRNWYPLIGLLVCVVAFVSYFLVFVRFPLTRDVPWANFLLFVIGVGFLFFGVRRPYEQPEQYRGRITSPILGILGLGILGVFSFAVFHGTKQLPRSTGAPHVGDKAPAFELEDTEHRRVTLANLLRDPVPASQLPPKGVLLVFYRGYW
jgi:hypothetical protein